MNTKEEEFYNELGDMFGDLFKSLGDKTSAHPEFKPTYYENVDIIYVWIALRKIVGVNHWAVIYKLSNDKYGITQFDTTGKIGLSDDNNTLEQAAQKTWGNLGQRVRLSCYGSCKRNYIKWLEQFNGKHTYILGLNDCQNFARKIVEDLTGNWVGVWPIEDGPSFGKRNVEDLNEIANRTNGFFAAITAMNPLYWLARGIAD